MSAPRVCRGRKGQGCGISKPASDFYTSRPLVCKACINSQRSIKPPANPNPQVPLPLTVENVRRLEDQGLQHDSEAHDDDEKILPTTLLSNPEVTRSSREVSRRELTPARYDQILEILGNIQVSQLQLDKTVQELTLLTSERFHQLLSHINQKEEKRDKEILQLTVLIGQIVGTIKSISSQVYPLGTGSLETPQPSTPSSRPVLPTIGVPEAREPLGDAKSKINVLPTIGVPEAREPLGDAKSKINVLPTIGVPESREPSGDAKSKINVLPTIGIPEAREPSGGDVRPKSNIPPSIGLPDPASSIDGRRSRGR